MKSNLICTDCKFKLHTGISYELLDLAKTRSQAIYPYKNDQMKRTHYNVI